MGYSFPRVSWLIAIAINVLVTIGLLLSHANETVAAIVYLVFIVWFATLAGPALSIYLAITSALLFDYCFLPPRFSLTLSGVQAWLSMLSYVASCLVVVRVAERARMQTRKAEQRRADVECLNSLSQEMMLHGDARGLIRDIPRLVEQVFGLDAVRLYVHDKDEMYSSVPGESQKGKAEALPGTKQSSRHALSGAGSDAADGYTSAELVFGMKSVGCLAWKPDKLSPEVATSVTSQVAIALTRAHAIEESGRLEAARSADRLRNALIDSLTHELRTPLTAIRAAVTTLLDAHGLDEETNRELVTIVDEESLRLDDLIGEAMEMAEIDSDGIRIQPQPVQILNFFEDAFERLHVQLKSHRVSIVVGQQDGSVMFDPHLIGRVIHHLLENAARYTPASSRIVLRSKREPGRIEFSVEDDGPGIDAHDLPMIFEKFYRGRHRTIAGKGSGMGLAICRSILLAHGGGIEVESLAGKGTTFRFWLPVVSKASGIGNETALRANG